MKRRFLSLNDPTRFCGRLRLSLRGLIGVHKQTIQRYEAISVEVTALLVAIWIDTFEEIAEVSTYIDDVRRQVTFANQFQACVDD